MKDYAPVIVVAATAVALRFMFLPDTIASSITVTESDPFSVDGILKSAFRFMIRNRIWMYIGLVMYFLFFARRSSSKQLLSSFKYDVAPLLRRISLALVLACVMGVPVLMYFYL